MMDKKRLTLATSAEDSKDVELNIAEKAHRKRIHYVFNQPISGFREVGRSLGIVYMIRVIRRRRHCRKKFVRDHELWV